MSQETLEWLNQMVLVGNTKARGTAWHYKASAQGAEANHYPGPIPVADVERRLFNWTAERRRVAVEIPASLEDATHIDNGGHPMRWVVQDDDVAICRSDDHYKMGIFTTGYTAHQYKEWLLRAVSSILGDTLGISSAGLLRKGSIAWVEISVPESVETPQGVKFRPNLLATTSFDGSCSTTYARTFTDTVCDNTRAVAMREGGPKYKRRHSGSASVSIVEARQALQMVHAMATDFEAEIAALCAVDVDPKQFTKFLDIAVPLINEDGTPKEGRGRTIADNKRDALLKLWRHDTRVTPWAGTAWGVLQMVNTFEHHESHIRGEATRAERNMLKTIAGEFDALDRNTWAQLQQALA